MASSALTEAIAALRLAEPALGIKAMTTRLQQQHPTWEVNTKLVRDGVTSLGSLASPQQTEELAEETAQPEQGKLRLYTRVVLHSLVCLLAHLIGFASAADPGKFSRRFRYNFTVFELF